VQRFSPVAGRLVKIVAWVSVIGAVLTGAHLVLSGQLPDPVPLAKSALDFHYAATSVAGEWFLICVRALAICAALVALWSVWVVLMIVGMPVSMVMSSLADDVRQADQDKTITVADRSAIAAAHTQFTARRQKNTSSRLTVLKADTPVWRQTVTAIADVCALPLIDISEPTDHVVWEVETLLHRFGHRCVFIGQHARVNALRIAALPGSPSSRVQTLLDGHEVLVYATASRRDIRRFTRALRATLEVHVRRPLPVG